MTNKPIQSVGQAIEEIQNSDWFKAAIGNDTLMRIRTGAEFHGENAPDNMTRIITSLLEHICDEIGKEHYCDNHEMCSEGCCNSHCCDDERLRIVTILTSAITGKKEI